MRRRSSAGAPLDVRGDRRGAGRSPSGVSHCAGTVALATVPVFPKVSRASATRSTSPPRGRRGHAQETYGRSSHKTGADPDRARRISWEPGLGLYRRIGMRYRHGAVSTGLLLGLAAAAVAGCGGAKTQLMPKPTLRGVLVSTFECPPHLTSPASTPTRIVGVRTLLLCPLNTPGVSGKAATISTHQPKFATLLAALSVPDEPSTTGACPAYGDLPQFVLAKTSNGVYEVSIPVDACRHYQRPVLEALNEARAS